MTTDQHPLDPMIVGANGEDADLSSGPDLPEIWGHGSFPASDPPANW